MKLQSELVYDKETTKYSRKYTNFDEYKAWALSLPPVSSVEVRTVKAPVGEIPPESKERSFLYSKNESGIIKIDGIIPEHIENISVSDLVLIPDIADPTKFSTGFEIMLTLTEEGHAYMLKANGALE